MKPFSVDYETLAGDIAKEKFHSLLPEIKAAGTMIGGIEIILTSRKIELWFKTSDYITARPSGGVTINYFQYFGRLFAIPAYIVACMKPNEMILFGKTDSASIILENFVL